MQSDTVKEEQEDARVEEGIRERRRRAATERETLGVTETQPRCSGGFLKIVSFLILIQKCWDHKDSAGSVQLSLMIRPQQLIQSFYLKYNRKNVKCDFLNSNLYP